MYVKDFYDKAFGQDWGDFQYILIMKNVLVPWIVNVLTVLCLLLLLAYWLYDQMSVVEASYGIFCHSAYRSWTKIFCLQYQMVCDFNYG